VPQDQERLGRAITEVGPWLDHGQRATSLLLLSATVTAQQDAAEQSLVPTLVGDACPESGGQPPSTLVRSEPADEPEGIPEMKVVAAGDGYAIARVVVDEALEVDDPRLSGQLTGEVRLLTTLDPDVPGEVERAPSSPARSASTTTMAPGSAPCARPTRGTWDHHARS
jgi:hypothetical protein